MTRIQPSHDLYAVLGVCFTAHHDEIRTAYRRLALKYHPDKNGGTQEATREFQHISTAWETLRDDSKRKAYDKTRTQTHASLNSSTAGPYPKPTSQAEKPVPQPDDARNNAKVPSGGYENPQEWAKWENNQQRLISASWRRVQQWGEQIIRTRAKVVENKVKIAHHIPKMWEVFAYLSPRLSEREHNLRSEILLEIRNEISKSEAVMRDVQTRLNRERIILNKLDLEMLEHRAKVYKYTRVTTERREKLAKAQNEKGKAKAGEKRKRADDAQPAGKKFRTQATESEADAPKRKAFDKDTQPSHEKTNGPAGAWQTNTQHETNAPKNGCKHDAWTFGPQYLCLL